MDGLRKKRRITLEKSEKPGLKQQECLKAAGESLSGRELELQPGCYADWRREKKSALMAEGGMGTQEKRCGDFCPSYAVGLQEQECFSVTTWNIYKECKFLFRLKFDTLKKKKVLLNVLIKFRFTQSMDFLFDNKTHWGIYFVVKKKKNAFPSPIEILIYKKCKFLLK